MGFKRVLGLLCAASISFVWRATASAQDKTVKIGAVFPLSGNAASAGVHAKAAIETAMDIINNAHPEFGNFPLAKNAGLAGLGGAKVEVVFADNQGSPATGQNQTLRLITEEKVVALTGAYQSGITLTASAIAEKYGIPFVNGELVAANLTERGFKWFFRTTPIASDFAKVYYDFLHRHEGGGRQDRQRRAGPRQYRIRHLGRERDHQRLQGEGGRTSRMDISYAVNATDVQSQVLQLKEKKPDVVIMVAYTSDAILYSKTMQALDYKPPMIIADDSGYSDPSFIKSVGKIIARRVQPLVVERRPSRLADGADCRDVQEEERRRDGRHRRAGDAGLLRALRCDRPRRLDRSRQDPGGAEGHRPEARSVDDGLQGRQVRRQGPERARGRGHDPVAGRRKLCRGLAEGERREGAGHALQGLVRKLQKGGNIAAALFFSLLEPSFAETIG